ncbi:MAG: 3-hydroxyacyl-CoA dehydrogenase NAD-binding domain-containing protein [Kangiellaceae bacterium]|jgi:3-hydroxyacyl-CoA dehydrogenase/enoyl-CoA hydratase/3-hydroxybutyryl-CoA epimerase|nr:3-hydroxyacyl-CoA dehydrogenase NAD-binding domain-containing protein [Kangiellaceae bacterium]
MQVIQYEKDANNIVHLILDRPNAGANLMDEAFSLSLAAVTEQLLQDDYIGVIVRSNKSTFFAGGDLEKLYAVNDDNADELFNMVSSIKQSFRALETQGKPVVACINGTALGGGWEMALACHQRIAVNNRKIKVGLPEVTLGLLPGAGGITRTVRLLGLQNALPFLAEGKQLSPDAAHQASLVHQLVERPDELISAATDFIKANESVSQPWDVKGYKLPGGAVTHPKIAQMLSIAPSMMRSKSRGCYPAPEAILATMVEGAQVDFDTANRIETRYLVELARGKVSKNMINAFWFQLNEIKALVGRPKDIPQQKIEKVGILGAGMMGAGIAYACATRGISVVLKDVALESAEKGKAYSETILAKRISRGKMTEDKMAGILSLIQPTDNADDLKGCDLVIEAVFENRELKAQVTEEAEAQLESSAVFASNTSTLPITGLAEASKRPANFIGLHFFSPVDKMPLVEIICGEKTSDDTLARSYDFVLQIAKTPIIVNDSRGFFTSRVFSTFVNEGIAMLGEGLPAAAIENAAFLSGFPVGPLAVSDEVTLSLMAKIRKQTIADLTASGINYVAHPSEAIIDRMLEMERVGKSTGAGFYDYLKDGKKHLWPGLAEHFGNAEQAVELNDMKDRLLFIMAIESVRCLEESVLTTTRDANIGSIFGIGYPAWTGGVIQFINQYGLKEFIERANQLEQQYGERFSIPKLLSDKVNNGERF